MDLSDNRFPQDKGHPLVDTIDKDRLARIYAMISNIDENVGRLFEKLDNLHLTRNTIVIFMVDNGPNGRRYVAGMNGAKTSVYEGGIHSPLFLHWPAELQAGSESDKVAAHIDILPTLLDACGVDYPAKSDLDGRSFLPLLSEENTAWPDRYLTIQAHRGNKPVRYHNFAIRNQRWKLLHASGFGAEDFQGQPEYELFDMENDPLEMNDLAAEKPEVVSELMTAYDRWFDDVSSTRPDNYEPPRIYIGTEYENPTVLTRQDWRHTKGTPWEKNSNGFWLLFAPEAGIYDFTVHIRNHESDGTLVLDIGGHSYRSTFKIADKEVAFKDINISAGDLMLKATLQTKSTELGAWQVQVKRTDI
jgi:arylsulfatase/arylsulfatase A